MSVPEVEALTQALVDCDPSLSADEARRQALGRALRHADKPTGAYYTPPALAEAIVADTLAPLVQEHDPLSIRVLDPAVGTGRFLVAAREFLAVEWSRRTGAPVEEGRRLVQERCLYGIDLDPVAVRAARALLGPGARLLVGDALRDDFPGPPFHAVVGNPPYVSHGLRDTGKLSPADRDFYRHRYPDSAQYKVSLYGLFVDRCLSWTRPDGVCTLLLPDSFLTGKYFQHLRERVLDRGRRLRSLTRFGQSFWPHADVGCPVILSAHGSPRGTPVTLTQATDLASWLRGEGTRSFSVPADTFVGTPRARFYFFLCRDDWDRYHRATAAGPPLGSVVKFYSGLIGKKGQRTIVLDAASARASGLRCSRLIESGRRLQPFALTWGGRYMVHDPARYKSGYTPAFYEAPKLVVNQTGDRPKACVDADGYYCLNNLHVGRPLGDPELLYLAAGVLNSEPGVRWYRFLAMETGRALAQVDIDILETLPLPPLGATEVPQIVELSRRLHRAPDAALLRELDRAVAQAYRESG